MAGLVQMVRGYMNKAKGNDKALAAALGYKTTKTLKTWVKKNRIPEFRRADIERVLSNTKE